MLHQLPRGQPRHDEFDVPMMFEYVPATHWVQDAEAARDHERIGHTAQLAEPLPENVDAGHARQVCAFIDGL